MKNMTKDYSSASFSTKGNWPIPMVLGWSKSIVSVGRPIGIMYTLHITPYLNIGFNNPRPKYQPRPVESISDCNCVGLCDCECTCHHNENEDLSPSPYESAIDFVMKSDSERVFAAIQQFNEDGTAVIRILVASDDVEIPDQFDGVPTVKDVVICPKRFHEDECK